MSEFKKLKDEQMEQISGGVVPNASRKYITEQTCKRCGKTFTAPEGTDMCPECKEETKVTATENGAYGGW